MAGSPVMLDLLASTGKIGPGVETAGRMKVTPVPVDRERERPWMAQRRREAVFLDRVLN